MKYKLKRTYTSKYDAAVITEIVRLRVDECLSWESISDATKIPNTSVREIFKRTKLSTTDPEKIERKKQRDAAILEDYVNGLPMAEIKRKHGIASDTTVRKLRKKYRVPKRIQTKRRYVCI